MWPYLTNEKVVALFGPYPPSHVPLKDITTEQGRGGYYTDVSSDLLLPLEAQPFTFKVLINKKNPNFDTTVPTTTPLKTVTKVTLITSTEPATTENVMITTPVEPISIFRICFE